MHTLIHLLLSSGPQSISSIHKYCPSLKLDVHVVTATPKSLILHLKDAGVSRFTFQYEIARDEVKNDLKKDLKKDINDGKIHTKKIDNNDNSIKLRNLNPTDEKEDEVEVEKKEEKKKKEAISSNAELEMNFRDNTEVEDRGGAIATAVAIRNAGMLCGVCIAPHTAVTELSSLLYTWYEPHTGCTKDRTGVYVTEPPDFSFFFKSVKIKKFPSK